MLKTTIYLPKPRFSEFKIKQFENLKMLKYNHKLFKILSFSLTQPYDASNRKLKIFKQLVFKTRLGSCPSNLQSPERFKKLKEILKKECTCQNPIVK